MSSPCPPLCYRSIKSTMLQDEKQGSCEMTREAPNKDATFYWTRWKNRRWNTDSVCSFISAVTLSYSGLTACTQHINTHAHLEVKCTPTPPNWDEGICFTQGLTQRAGTSSVVLTLWSGCPLFWPSWLCLSTMGKRQTVNYFVHITHVPQLRQEHLVTVPEITVPQWRTRKVRQMEGQRRKSRAASHPLLGFFFFPW